MDLQKKHKFISQKLRDSANGEPCIACHTHDGTTILAHSNELSHGKGMSTKAHDLLSLYLCRRCHDLYDREMSKSEARLFFREYYPIQMTRICEKLASGELKL